VPTSHDVPALAVSGRAAALARALAVAAEAAEAAAPHPEAVAGAARALRAREVSGWPERCKLARAFLWECSDEMLELAQLLGRRGVFLTYHFD
jgi:hypothetical protein